MWNWKKRVEADVSKDNECEGCDHTKNYRLNSRDPVNPLIQNFVKSFEHIFGFQLADLTSFENFVKLLYRPTDPSSLGVARALFGLCMVIDIVHERGLSDIDKKWGDPRICRFPLIHGMVPPTLPWMIIIYTIMWFGAFGIMLGYRFRFSCFCFVLPYWYIFLLDKTFWNNHSYLYGIVATLFWGTGADQYFSVNETRKKPVPLWNYFILRFQFFLLYFLAGLKKTDTDWLNGYSVITLVGHWVFLPFTIILTPEQTNYFIVHLFGFLFDLTVGFLMIFDRTRFPAMIFCTAFHLMNSRLFPIGMFPYTCLATMPLFCHVDWPRKFEKWIKSRFTFNFDWYSKIWIRKLMARAEKSSENNNEQFEISENDRETEGKSDDIFTQRKDERGIEEKKDESVEKEEKCISLSRNVPREEKKVTRKKKFVVSLLLLHIGLQFFMPYSHFITKGYNNWVPGLYGYSWNMMVNYWDTIAVVVQVRDNTNNEDFFIHPHAYVGNNKWWKHGDMVMQYAHCLKDNLMQQKQLALSSEKRRRNKGSWEKLSSNISIFVDVWCSLNGRFQQRMFKPNVDILTAEWHPFKPLSFLVPLLTQFSSYRYKLEKIQQEVYTWSNYSDVYFVADYPEMQKLNFVDEELKNVSLSVIEGRVSYTEEGKYEEVAIPEGGTLKVPTGKFHEVKVISSVPACYMYTFINQTEQYLKTNRMDYSSEIGKSTPLFRKMKQDIEENLRAWLRALIHIKNGFVHIFLNNLSSQRNASEVDIHRQRNEHTKL